MSETVEVKTVQKLYSLPGYVECYFKILQDNPGLTMGAAYEMLEKQYFNIFGARKFASYHSFRVTVFNARRTAKIMY